jgi:hypothetical protein
VWGCKPGRVFIERCRLGTDFAPVRLGQIRGEVRDLPRDRAPSVERGAVGTDVLKKMGQETRKARSFSWDHMDCL